MPRSSARFACLLAVLVPSAAQARVTVSVTDGTKVYVSETAVEADTITVTRAGGTVTIRATPTAPVDDAAECMTSTDDPSAIVCSIAEPTLESVFAGDLNDTVTIDGIGVRELYGGTGDDTLTGGALADSISGNEDNDRVVGGGGADTLNGDAGTDRLEARDGVVDVGVTCGDGDGDVSVTDADDPHAAGCESDDRAALGGGGTPTTPPADADGDGVADASDNCPARSNADQHDADGDTKGDACDIVDTRREVEVPDWKPYQRNGKWRFHSLDEVREEAQKLRVPYRVQIKRKGLAGINGRYRKSVDDGDVVAQGGPAPGDIVEIDTACPDKAKPGCRLNIRINVYDEATELKGHKCPYKDRKGTDLKEDKQLRQVLEGQTYEDALKVLADQKCNYRVVNYVESKTDSVERVLDAQTSKVDNRFFINLLVQRPLRSDFTVSLAPRPYADYQANPSRLEQFERELDLGSDGKLTYSENQPNVLTVIVNENLTGRFVSNMRIELVQDSPGRAGDGKVLGSSETGNTGAVTFTVPIEFTGELEINVRVLAKRTQDDLVEDTMRGWITVPVARRDTKGLLGTQSGRAFRFKSGRWQRVDVFVEAMKGFAEALRSINDAFAAGATCRAQEGDANVGRLVNACWKDGLSVTKTSNGGSSVGTGMAPAGTTSGYVVRNGQLAEARVPAVAVPGSGAVLGLASRAELALTGRARVQGGLVSAEGTPTNLQGARIISDKGAGLIGADGATLIGPDGGSLIGPDGGSLISDKGVGLLPTRLIGPDGGS